MDGVLAADSQRGSDPLSGVPVPVIAVILSELTSLAQRGELASASSSFPRSSPSAPFPAGANTKTFVTGDRRIRAMALHAASALFVRLPWNLRGVVLPGVVSACATVLLGDFKLGYQVFAAGADALAAVLEASIGDAELAIHIPDAIRSADAASGVETSSALARLRELQVLASRPSQNSTSTDIEAAGDASAGSGAISAPPRVDNPMNAQLDKSWLDGVVGIVDKVLRRVLVHRAAQASSSAEGVGTTRRFGVDPLMVQHPRVREAIARFVRSLTRSCSHVLAGSMDACLDAVVSLLHDPIVEVRQEAQEALDQFVASVSGETDFTRRDQFASFVREQLHRSLLQLPRCLSVSPSVERRPSADDQLLGTLSLIQGYFMVLAQFGENSVQGSDKSLQTTLVSSLPRLGSALLLLLEFDFAAMGRAGLVDMSAHIMRLFDSDSCFRLPRLGHVQAEGGSDAGLDLESNESSSVVDVPPFFRGYPRAFEFQYFRASNVLIFTRTAAVVRLLAVHGAASAVAEHFLARVRLTPENAAPFAPQALWVVNEMLLGLIAHGQESKQSAPSGKSPVFSALSPASLVSVTSTADQHRQARRGNERSRKWSAFVDEILRVILIDSAGVVWNIDEGGPTPDARIRSEVTVCNALQCIGSTAELIGDTYLSEASSEVRFSVLYRLVEKLGSASPAVGVAAWTTLVRMAAALGFGRRVDSVSRMLHGYANHILDPLEFRLHRLREFPRTPQVLLGLLRCVNSGALVDGEVSFSATGLGSGLIPLLDDALESVLDALSRSTTGSLLWGVEEEVGGKQEDATLLRVLGQIVLACCHDNASLEKSSFSVAHVLLRILEISQHFVAGSNRLERLLILDMVAVGLPVIASVAAQQDDDEEGSGVSPLTGRLLPLIHALWSPIIAVGQSAILVSSTQQDNAVAASSLSALRSMISTGGSFTAQRFEPGCWPLAQAVLRRAQEITVDSRILGKSGASSSSNLLEVSESALKLLVSAAQELTIGPGMARKMTELVLPFVSLRDSTIDPARALADLRPDRLRRVGATAYEVVQNLAVHQGGDDDGKTSDGVWLSLCEHSGAKFTAPRTSSNAQPWLMDLQFSTSRSTDRAQTAAMLLEEIFR
jgi:TELO2-interacting protein 1